jgi:hypothetical protein
MDNYTAILFGESAGELRLDSGRDAFRRSTDGDRARQTVNLCYLVFVKTSELKRWRVLRIAFRFLISASLMIASAFTSRASSGEGYKPILYPSIFWHNNQWETYENGQWIPYRGRANTQTALEPEPEFIPPEPLPGPDIVDTNNYVPPYGWGFIGAPAFYPSFPPNHRHMRANVRGDRQRHGRPPSSIGQPNAGLGRTTIGIGRPNVGIGQTTIGIGRPNVGIGQTTAGLGQPNTGIGRPNAGVGQTTIGIGQPNAGVGQPTVSVGQPNAGIGRPTIGIGQPMSGQHSEAQRGR